MRYFYDFEFVERGPEHPLRPISLGMVAEDGRELYMQFMDYLQPATRNPWLVENVLSHLSHFNITDQGYTVDPPPLRCFDVENIDLDRCPWLYATDAGKEIEKFMRLDEDPEKPQLWGYYADYDHVLFAQLFGTMMTMPKDMPIWTRDLKQVAWSLGNPELPTLSGGQEHNALHDAREIKYRWEFLRDRFMRLSDAEANALMGATFGLRTKTYFTAPDR